MHPLKMYFSAKVARQYAEHEQNDKHRSVADAVDRVIMAESTHLDDPLHVADLGAGAHPDRYDQLFARLLHEPRGQLDWVDISPVMIGLAREYLNRAGLEDRLQVIRFLPLGLYTYLFNLPPASLDLVIVKYVMGYIKELFPFFHILSEKLKPGGRLVATVSDTEPVLKSHSTNVIYTLNGHRIPHGETRALIEGDKIGIRFLRESSNPQGGVIPDAETQLWYHAGQTYQQVAKRVGFDCFLGDWKEVVAPMLRQGFTIRQTVLVLRK